jgi:2-succinyl-6-hydroxy-2,4-cyclohexadiene-1-carboxylate synthase
MEIENDRMDFWQWADHFNSSVKKSNSKNILLGYSLGGRLAMHSLIANPGLWDAAIFISANPGIASSKEKGQRLISDEKWATRFLNDPWHLLMEDWNTIPVFDNRHHPILRKELDFDRKQLANLLVNWSIAKQDSLLDKFKRLSVPMLYIAGEQDPRFSLIAEQFRDFAKVSIIPDAAHRVPWDQPKMFINTIDEFIGGL